MITFQCDGCGMTHRSSDEFSGTRAKCLKCGAVIEVPGERTVAVKNKKKKKVAKAVPDEVATQTREPEPEPEYEAREVKEDSKAKLKETLKQYRKHLMIAGGVLVVAVVAYFLFRSQSRPAPQLKKEPEVVKAPPVKPPPEKPKETPVPKAEPVAQVYYMTATKLSALHQANSLVTNERYLKKTFEIRGHIVKVTDPPPPPKVEKDAPEVKDAKKMPGPGPTLWIADSDGEEGTNAISCNIPAGVPKDQLPRDLKGLPVTIRAVYDGDLKFKDGVVTRWQAKADDVYKGKMVELMGIVDNAGDVKYVRLDPFNTESMLEVSFFARGSEEKPLNELRVGQSVVIRGTCAGRRFKKVEIHNCQLSPTRLGSVAYPRFVVDYESDLWDEAIIRYPDHPIVIPAPSLVAAYEKSPDGAVEAYHRRILVTSGLIERIDRQRREIIFESDTDRKLKVVCRLTQAQLDRIGRQKRLLIRGVCTNVKNGRIVLENSALELSPRLLALLQMGPILLPEHYPFLAGDQIEADVAHGTVTPKTVSHLAIRFKDPNVIEFINTSRGTLNIGGLKTGDIQWSPKEKLAPPVATQYRISEYLIETSLAGPNGETFWEPVLKLGAREGEFWTWDSPFGFCTYTATEVGKAATVRKVMQSGNTIIESIHHYQLGVGERERMTYQAAPGQQKKLIAEMLVR